MGLEKNDPVNTVAIIIASIIMLFVFFILFVSPILSFAGVFPTTTSLTSGEFDKIYLDYYVNDPNYSDDQITWNHSGDSNLTVLLDDINRTATVSFPGNWYDSETILFTATNPDGKNFSEYVTFSIYKQEKPVIVSNIPNQRILSGNNFETILINDSYNIEDLIEQFNKSALDLEINDNNLTINYPAGWTGTQTIIFNTNSEKNVVFSDYVTFSVVNEFVGPYIQNIPNAALPKITISESILLFSSIFTVAILVGAPIIWYILVNRYGIKQILTSLKLKIEDFDEAFLWGIVAAVSIFFIVILLGSLLYSLGVDESSLSNVEDLAGNLSIVSMFFIIIFQSIAEEVFFRGFLLEKIESFAGITIAIVITSVLFGLAHLAYGKLYPAVMPMLMGIILAYIVYRTKNLSSAIIAHMLFNTASFVLYLFSQNLGI